MAQSTTGTILTTAAAQTSREIAFKVYIDFDDDGFPLPRVDPVSAGWTDVSAYVKRLQGDHQATDWRKSPAIVGSGVADEVTVTLRNPEETSPYTGLRYSATNEGSSLYSQIGSGLINMKRAIVEMGFTYGGDTDRTRQITGYITGVNEGRQGRNVSFTIRDRAADATHTRESTALYNDTTASDWVETLGALLGKDALTTSQTLIDDGMMIIPWAWLDDDSIWDELSRVAEAQLGRVWFDKDGILHFDDGTHFVKPADNSWDDATVSQFDFTTSNCRSIDGTYSMGSVYNHIVVEYQPRYVATHQVVYSATETTIVPPSDSRNVKAEFRYPVYDAEFSIWGADELEVDIAACTAGGTDISSDISYSLDTYAGYTTVAITNSNEDFAAYVYQLDIRGQPLLTDQADKYEAENSTSIGRYGRRTWQVRNAYIQTYQHAKMVGDYLLARYKDPIHVVQIAGARGVPWLEVGDRVTITDSLTGLDDEYFLVHIRWTFASGSPYTMDVTAMKAGDLFSYLDEYFVLGTSWYGSPMEAAYSLTATPYGRVFW